MQAIRTATTADVPAIGAMLARAFDDDPFINFLIKQDRKRIERIETWARVATEQTIGHGETYVTDDLTAAALWVPPGEVQTGPRGFERWRRLRHRAGPIGALRLRAALDLLDAHSPTAPHAYFRIVGVEPTRQGEGLGSALIAHGLERWDRAGQATHLFSTKERNVPLYERHGFEVTERLELPGGPPVWLMWRNALA